jgi:hypothetical protein
LTADATDGEVTFVAEQDTSKGMKLLKQQGGQLEKYAWRRNQSA